MYPYPSQYQYQSPYNYYTPTVQPYSQSPTGQPNNNNSNNQLGLRGRPVTSIDEVRGSIIDQDGSLFIFPDIGHNKIYTKQINLDGTATINSFGLETQPQQVEKTYVEFSQLEQVVTSLTNEINKLKQEIENLTPVKEEKKSKAKGD